jgi:hypothetical protein
MPVMPVFADRPRTPADGRFSAETAILCLICPVLRVRRHYWE